MDGGPVFSLENILNENHAHLEHPGVNGDETEPSPTPVKAGMCIECEDQPAEVSCETCADVFCEVCYASQHRKGSRQKHVMKPLSVQEKKKVNGSVADTQEPEAMEEEDDGDNEWERVVPITSTEVLLSAQPAVGTSVGEWFVQRAAFIPIRLTLSERKFLRLLEAALSVSEYTDKIDTIGFGYSKAKRIVHQIRELCAIMSGLLLSADYKRGQELFTDRDFKANDEFYQDLFELGRRYKIMNPHTMRSTYGKLIYLLMDSQSPEVKDMLGFSCVRPIKTVHSLLEECNALDLLRDDLITVATKEIYAEGRSRRDVQKDIKSKEKAIETLATRYVRQGLSRDDIRQCLYSIGDNHAFLRTNRDPCERMIAYLKQYFHPTEAKDSKVSLAIRSGKNGARLSHDHSKQYAYVIQSLTLWREILHDFFHLWSLAENDLLSENVPYRLRDTGQGLNRVQASPKTSRLMHQILNKAQQSVGQWIGSSVIHMGDHNVPNALLFIDKYTQIYRILLPICNTLGQIDDLATKPAIRSYIDDEFGGPDNLRREILGDFFRHGFDGSGADNFFDAGSCIDGRLTSAWNWCSALEKKRYFHVFLLTGFVGFDGEW
ncbi:B box-type domain-containing protein [Mycena indigotica]|uniref:B box-type domain-containing protein n=1 Tax=Mycena indigotica TaxID=2126181 RepID=A0A8H6W1H1_9AGAR|nr:B box-type domain-containing protein [Mycena indigotica]KAF7302069.1 B box-type domain-containing protein [Mycena indigotica]